MTNEVAERLLAILDDDPDFRLPEAHNLMDEALAAERRATVERMRPYFEDMADALDAEGEISAAVAANLRAAWRQAHDAAIFDAEADR